MRHHTLHGMRIEILSRSGVIRDHTHDAALFRAGQREIPGGPRHGHHAVDVADAVFAQGLNPARVGADDLVRQVGVFTIDGRLRAGDLLPGIDSPGTEVGDGLDGVIAGMVVDHGEGAARHGGFGQHLFFGRLIQREDAELRVPGKSAGAPEDLRRLTNLGAGERGQRMRSGGL